MKPAKGAALTLSVFIASAVVLFGVVLTGYLISRFNDPDAYAWAPRLLDRRLAIAGGCALLLLCIAAAAAMRLARKERPAPARVLLLLALAAGCVATGARALECPPAAKLAGVARRARPDVVAKPAPKPKPGAPALAAGSVTRGKPVYMKTCAACHAPDGAGIKGQGASLKDSAFVKARSDDQLLTFVKVGRQPFDPETRMHLSMPARGGNPSLSDQDLFDALAMVRELQVAAAVPVPAEGTVTAVAPPKPISDQPQMIDGALWYPHSILAAASVGPRGTSRTAVRLQKPGAVGRSPENVRRFFSFALLVSGLHGIYLAIGIVMGTAVLAHAPSRRSPATLRMVAVYWLVVGGLGLVLLPATYF